ncbi:MULTISPECIES: hypothetical protein [Micromonospora]|uniref:hypothetical protein n=1 Tax=Micromonospora TaxID=1873 RepID=UPI0006961E4B|nr:hypothetical protein [Micromonospora haikouensis]
MEAEVVFPEGAWHKVRFGLFVPTLDYGGSAWGRDVLDPWVSAHLSILAALRQVGEARMAAVALAREDLWALYALSRVMELLSLPSQPPATDPGDPADWLASSAYAFDRAIRHGSVRANADGHPLRGQFFLRRARVLLDKVVLLSRPQPEGTPGCGPWTCPRGEPTPDVGRRHEQ